MKKILIIGATSAITEATARLWAKEGHSLYLVARDEERLQTIAQDLKIRGAEAVHITALDLCKWEKHQTLIQNAIQTLGSIDIAFIGYGTLGDQKVCEQDFNMALQEFNTNAISVLSLLTHLANYFEIKQSGTIAVISSVAGDRGRQSNYVYGAAKGTISLFMQGLRQRLQKSGVHVLTIKPGFVDTPMTRNFKKGALWSTAEAAAQSIHKAVARNRNVQYVPFFWLGIMTIIRLIPEGIFKRLRL